MADAVVKYGWDNTEAARGAREAVDLAQNVKRRTDEMLNTPGVGGRTSGRLGMASMQMQDILVQIQGGTRLSTIFAQQGAQLASIFGSGGAIIGGAAALAGLLVTVGQKGNEAFDGMIKGAKGLADEINKLAAGGAGLSDLGKSVDQIQSQTKAFDAERKSIESVGGALKTVLGAMMGGFNSRQKLGAIDEQQAALAEAQKQAVQSILQSSAQELQLSTLRARGREKEADEMERQISLAKKLAEIENAALPPDAKRQLSLDAAAQSAADRDAKARAKGPSAMQRDFDKLLGEANKPQIEGMADAEKYQALVALAEKMKTESRLRADFERQAADGNLAGATETLQLLKERREIERELAKLNADMRKDAVIAAQKNSEAKQKEKDETKQRRAKNREEDQKQNQAEQDLAGGMMVLSLRANGRKKEADELQRQLDILRESKKIQEDTGLSKDAAMNIAKRKSDLEQQAAERERSDETRPDGRRRTKGYGREQYERNRFIDHRDFNEFFHGNSKAGARAADQSRRMHPEKPGANDRLAVNGIDTLVALQQRLVTAMEAISTQ